MKPCTTIIVVLFMTVVSASLTSASPGEDSGPQKGNCPRPHEEWTDCGPVSDCTPTCAEPVIIGPCPDICIAQCVCEKGFIRRSQNGPCISECDCPNDPCAR